MTEKVLTDEVLEEVHKGELINLPAPEISNAIAESTLQLVRKEFGLPSLASLETIHDFVKEDHAQKLAVELRTKLADTLFVPLTIATFLEKNIDASQHLIAFEEHFRIHYPSERGSGVSLVAPHRDTWISLPKSAINIWIPCTDTPNVCLDFFPELFSSPLKTYRNRNGEVSPIALSQDDLLKVSPEVPLGNILLFRGKHLHASANNLTSKTRVSWDYRLIRLKDLSPSLRLHEFIFVDLLLDNPLDLERAQAHTNERLSGTGHVASSVSRRLTMKKKANGFVEGSFIYRMLRRLRDEFSFLFHY